MFCHLIIDTSLCFYSLLLTNHSEIYVGQWHMRELQSQALDTKVSTSTLE